MCRLTSRWRTRGATWELTASTSWPFLEPGLTHLAAKWVRTLLASTFFLTRSVTDSLLSWVCAWRFQHSVVIERGRNWVRMLLASTFFRTRSVTDSLLSWVCACQSQHSFVTQRGIPPVGGNRNSNTPTASGRVGGYTYYGVRYCIFLLEVRVA